MKVVINLNDDKKDVILNFLESNNLKFEYEYNTETPQWQIDGIRNRQETSLANPSANLTYAELKDSLWKGRQLFSLEFNPSAEADIRDTRFWYNSKLQNLGDEYQENTF